MKRHLRAVFLTLATLGAVAACVHGGVQEEVVAPYQEVRVGHGIGSGTVVKVDGEVLILTAAHVVEAAKKDTSGETAVEVFCEEGGRTVITRCEVVAYSPPEEDDRQGNDLALLKPASAVGLVPATLGLGEKLTAGQEVWYIGTPYGTHGILEKSVISKVDHRVRQLHNQSFFLVNGCGWFGNSGGGVYVKAESGKLVLVGVVTRAINGSPKTPLGCERPETIKKFLDAYRASKGDDE